jgi:hypothetical protein
VGPHDVITNPAVAAVRNTRRIFFIFICFVKKENGIYKVVAFDKPGCSLNRVALV